MSFNSDKKAEHESMAEKALQKKDYAKAFFHTAKAAEFGFNLAEMSDGRLAKAYLDDANELLGIAAKLKKKAGQKKKVKQAAEADGKDSGGGKDDPADSPWQITERPDIKLDDVAGLGEVKAALREDVILPFNHPEVYDRFGVRGGGGVLMYGPPGNGKTFIARAIAGELDAAFFTVDASQIKDKYVGETEKNMRKLFEDARKHERAVIFLDEIDAIVQKRGAQKVNAVTQFLIMADGITNMDDGGMLLLLGATNKPWSIDPAALRPGRFGRQIYVGLPDAKARAGIIEYSFKNIPLDENLSFKKAAQKMEGFSGADVAEVCGRAKKKAIMRQIETDREEVVTQQDFLDSISNFSPSVSKADLAAFEDWRKEHSSGEG